MNSIVMELQQDALDSSIRLPDLLRKALVVARKLRVKELEAWINRELYGYESSDDIPSYRLIKGEVKAWNPFHGWIPILLNDSAIMEQISERYTSQPISEMEALIDTANDHSELTMPRPKELELRLMRVVRAPTPPTLIVPATRLKSIVDAVRSVVLNWSLKLEEDGILGEGLSFSSEEKQRAAQNIYQVNHFYGNVSTSHTNLNAGRDVNVRGDVAGRDKKTKKR